MAVEASSTDLRKGLVRGCPGCFGCVMNVILSRGLIEQGFSYDELVRQSRRGEIVRVRRGAYTRPPGKSESPEIKHLQLIRATVPQLGAMGCLSHTSAAAVHGLPIWPPYSDRVHLTRPQLSGQRRRNVHIHPTPLGEDEVVRVDGLWVTSLARTVVDLARTIPFELAVAAGDAALRTGLDRTKLEVALASARRRPGMATAKRVIAFLDERSESAGESFSRIEFHRLGLPTPQLQFEVRDDLGSLVGRSDFCWEEQADAGRIRRQGQVRSAAQAA